MAELQNRTPFRVNYVQRIAIPDKSKLNWLTFDFPSSNVNN